MKKFLLTLTAIFICTVTFAKTINWYVGDTVYQTTTCESGSAITPPTPPVKNGYTFVGWKSYVPIKYLESTGTQYIDAKYSFVNILYARIVLDAIFYSGPGGQANGWRVTGVAASSGGPNIGMANGGGIFSYTAGTTTDQYTNIYGKNGERYLFDLNIPDQTYTVSDIYDNILVEVNPINRSNRTTSSFIIFGYRASNRVSMRIYSLKMWDNGVLVRDFIPVLDNNGTPCMYDKVEDKFFYNAGTGNFIAGPVIGE